MTMAHLNLLRVLLWLPPDTPERSDGHGSIAGGEKEVQWIIKGDEKGEYDLAGVRRDIAAVLRASEKIFRTSAI